MPIFLGNTEITSIHYGANEIAEVYKGSTKLWPSDSGGTLPSGTVVIGAALTDDSSQYTIVSGVLVNQGSLTATWNEANGTTTISKIKIRCRGWDGGNVKALLYSGAGSLIAISNAVTFGYGNPATFDFAFASPPTITKNDTYRLALIADTPYAIQVSKSGSTSIDYDNSGSYASPPTTLSAVATGATGVLGMWAVV